MTVSSHAMRAAFAPPVPTTFAELGIAESLVLDLVLRRMLLEGYSNLQTLAAKLRLSIPIVDQTFRQMRQQQLVEVKGMAGNDYNFVLSQAAGTMRRNRLK